jgi:hypothetical protein
MTPEHHLAFEGFLAGGCCSYIKVDEGNYENGKYDANGIHYLFLSVIQRLESIPTFLPRVSGRVVVGFEDVKNIIFKSHK